MGAFKEEVRILEDIASVQERIYPDSADYGVKATPGIKILLRRVINTLLEIEENKVIEKVDTKSITTRAYRLTIRFSSDDRDGVTYTVYYHKDKSRKIEFFSIDSQRVNDWASQRKHDRR